MTFEQKFKVLLSYGFFIGLRDPIVKPDFPGHYMVIESLEDKAAPDTWALVGDDLSSMVEEAIGYASDFTHYDVVAADIQNGGVGLLHVDGTAAGPITR